MPVAAIRPPKAAPPAAPDPDGATRRLETALGQLRAQTLMPLLAEAIAAVNAGRTKEARGLVAQVLKADSNCGLGFHVLALCNERDGDLNGALAAYETALSLDPEDIDLANDLGRLAMQMGQPETAVELFRLFAAKRPECPDGANNLGCALRDLMRYGEAIEVLRPAIEAHPESALLWNTLATVVAEEGEVDRSAVFFDEALRLDPGFAKARYNRANIRLMLGDPEGALADCEGALAAPSLTEPETAMMRFARATMLLASGRTGEGWDAYDARLDPRLADVTHFATELPRWTAGTPLEGRRLLVSGEQGLGDEVLFANVLPDVIGALGPRGELSIAVERRLAPLFQRSFPAAEVSAHATYRVEHQSVRAFPATRNAAGLAGRAELWAPMASLLAGFRREVGSFPSRPAFLRPDPARVAHWRGELASLGDGPKVGIVWKSLKLNSQRARFFSPFQAWAPVLGVPGARFVNLQYGDCAAEMAWARDALGIEVWSPPGLDLKDDLDDLAALSAALDLAMGPANASLNIAAACGAPAWFVSTPGAWPLLGSGAYPWYPEARVFSPQRFNAWEGVMDEIAEALRREVAVRA